MPYIEFRYMYRDASNYKSYKTVYFDGSVTGAQVEAAEANTLIGGIFYPDQVGLESAFYEEFGGKYDDDTPEVNELLGVRIIPADIPNYTDNDPRAASEFLDAFAATVWDIPEDPEPLTAYEGGGFWYVRHPEHDVIARFNGPDAERNANRFMEAWANQS